MQILQTAWQVHVFICGVKTASNVLLWKTSKIRRKSFYSLLFCSDSHVGVKAFLPLRHGGSESSAVTPVDAALRHRSNVDTKMTGSFLHRCGRPWCEFDRHRHGSSVGPVLRGSPPSFTLSVSSLPIQGDEESFIERCVSKEVTSQDVSDSLTLKWIQVPGLFLIGKS